MKHIVGTLCLLGSLLCFGQTQFPELIGTDLNDKKVELPESVQGKFSIVGIAYSKKAEDALVSWREPIYYEFIDKSGLAALVYDVDVFLVLMFTGVNRSVYGKYSKKLKQTVEDQYKDQMLLYSGNIDSYKSSLGINQKDIPYLFVLNKEGQIIHKTSGRYSSKKLEQIGALVEE